MTQIHAALPTPLTAADTVDVASLERVVRRCLDGGAAGLVALGSTGEAMLLTDDERRTVLDVCRASGAPLTVGAGGAGTAATIAEARGWQRYADALLVPVPYYVRPDDDAVVAHFAAVTAALDVPVIVYDIPYRTGKRLAPDALLRILDLDGVAAMKHCPGALGRDTLDLIANSTKPILCGDDALLFPMLALGAEGGVTATACLVPEAYRDMRLDDHDALLPLLDTLAEQAAPAVLKGALAELGVIDTPLVRAPLTPARPLNARRAARQAEAAARTAHTATPRYSTAGAP
ncbi:dihydrodipicolinate synthase family protein [Actinomadura flavalba]|uniref:dihydrodipicolinate synthase family protein n=1 Tax=Actinomadura flavalba TaxID=1120938 RepID=UPI00036FE2ED|nr:dihydrodipicolinate synthase family protein [Actinomadura flavalba]